MTYDCVVGDHGDCPDNELDTYTCSCPCHLDNTDYGWSEEAFDDSDEDEDCGNCGGKGYRIAPRGLMGTAAHVCAVCNGWGKA